MKHTTLIIILLLTAACAHNNLQPTESASKTVCTTHDCLLAFGDSITAGMLVSKGFIQIIAETKGMEMIDLGIGHSLIVGQLPGILAYPYNGTETIVFLSGFNDMRGHGTDPVALDDYKTKLTQILNLWASKGVTAYLGTCLHQMPAGYPVYDGIGSDQAALLYAQALKDVAVNYTNVIVVDTNVLYNPTPSITVNDLIHPNEAGHQILAQLFLNVM